MFIENILFLALKVLRVKICIRTNLLRFYLYNYIEYVIKICIYINLFGLLLLMYFYLYTCVREMHTQKLTLKCSFSLPKEYFDSKPKSIKSGKE